MSKVRGTRVSQAFMDGMQADLQSAFEPSLHRAVAGVPSTKGAVIKRLYARLMLKLIRPALQADRRDRSVCRSDASVRVS